jgi:16S rRNA (cytosine967-C5)-methyltransferase
VNAATPSPAAIRAAAARVVAAVVDRGRSLDELLTAEPLSGSARGLLRALCFGTLRWHWRLVPLLEPLCERPFAKLGPELRALLEIGAWQLVHGGVAPHAAIAETVEAARVLGQPRAAGFVNAILRRLQREQVGLVERVDQDLARRSAHPRWLVEQLRHDWPEQHAQILAANNIQAPLWLRVNRLRITVEAARQRLVEAGLAVEGHPLAPQALCVTPAVEVHALPGFDAGELSVQDPAAQLAVELLGAQPGERVLDACAAPGGKTCHLQEHCDNALHLLALDVADARLPRILDNLQRLGLQALVRAGDAARPADWWDGHPFDRILLDVPCSATGVIRRHPDIKLLRRPGDIPALARRQAELLDALWPLLRPGGRLLYTSCSVLQAENAAVVGAFLARQPAALERTPELISGWPASAAPGAPGYALLPGHMDSDGFYYACLDKRER